MQEKRGFTLVYDYESKEFDFENELNYSLPEGFHFVNPLEADPVKLSKCCWYGFDYGKGLHWYCWKKQSAKMYIVSGWKYKDG